MRLAFACKSLINFDRQLSITTKTTVIQDLFTLESLSLRDDCLQWRNQDFRKGG